ncbi:MAG: hypothetical protein V8R40_07780 [Dysosmobacter sp.]
MRELDELYTKLQIITGFTVEQLLEMFAAGYTLEKPDYQNHLKRWRVWPKPTPPNDPLTLEELRKMDGELVWSGSIKRWGLVKVSHCGIGILTKCGEYDVTRMKLYRRPPEGEEDT